MPITITKHTTATLLNAKAQHFLAGIMVWEFNLIDQIDDPASDHHNPPNMAMSYCV
jgi:hypothetical protein